MRKRAFRTSLVLLAVSLLLWGCGRRETVKPPKIVIIGVDGAGWNIIDPLLEEGALPNFRALIDGGSSGVLKTFRPVKSSVIWTSIATGKTMDKHGISDWTFKTDEKTEVPFRQNERIVKAFWNIFGDQGRTVGVINWFITFPPEPVNGYMVSEEFRNLVRRKTFTVDVTYPKELLKVIESSHPAGFMKILKEEGLPDYRKGSEKGNLGPHYPNFVYQDKTIENASVYLFKNYPVDVFATYFRLIDVISHFACVQIDEEIRKKCEGEEKAGGISPETRLRADRAYSRILKPLYVYADRIIGRFMSMADPETTFIIVSDHSFEAHYGGYGHTDTPHIPHGIVLVKGPNIKKGFRIPDMNIYDVLPTILHIGGLPAAQDMDGRVLSEVFTEEFRSQVTLLRSEEGSSRELHETTYTEEAEEEIKERLRGLGYLG